MTNLKTFKELKHHPLKGEKLKKYVTGKIVSCVVEKVVENPYSIDFFCSHEAVVWGEHSYTNTTFSLRKCDNWVVGGPKTMDDVPLTPLQLKKGILMGQIHKELISFEIDWSGNGTNKQGRKRAEKVSENGIDEDVAEKVLSLHDIDEVLRNYKQIYGEFTKDPKALAELFIDETCHQQAEKLFEKEIEEFKSIKGDVSSFLSIDKITFGKLQ